jgi:isocitrate dehydrogenase (NAD+)
MVNVSYPVTLIPGDGIGPEVAEAAVRAVNATGVSIDWQRADLNASIITKAGQVLPPHVIESIERTHVGLKGPVTTPIGGGFSSVNVALRKQFDLYANVRPVHSLPGLKTRFDDVTIDMVIFRENTEDLYSGLEHEVVKDVVTSLKVITRTASIRIAEYAFDFARKTGRKRVAAIHKANIMKLADGLFLRCCREVAAKFPEIEYKELIVDNASMQLVIRPETFDILLLPNLYGDIVSDLAAGLVGGLGVVPGANMGDRDAVFEAVHGSAPDIAGKGIANPTALILSSVLMLIHLGELDAARRLRGAVERTYAEGKRLPPDVGGSASTREFTDAVIANLTSRFFTSSALSSINFRRLSTSSPISVEKISSLSTASSRRTCSSVRFSGIMVVSAKAARRSFRPAPYSAARRRPACLSTVRFSVARRMISRVNSFRP